MTNAFLSTKLRAKSVIAKYKYVAKFSATYNLQTKAVLWSVTH